MVGIAMVGRFLMSAYIQPAMAERKAAKAALKSADTGEDSWFKKNFTKIAIAFLLIYPPLVLMLVRRSGLAQMGRQFRHPDPDLCDAGMGLSTSSLASPVCSILAMSPSMRSAPIPTRCCRAILACHSGCCCRLQAFWQPSGASFSASRSCGCEATIWPLSRLAFGEIIRLVLINWTAVTKGTFGISGIAKATLFGFYEFNATPDWFCRPVRPRAIVRLLQDFPILPDLGTSLVDRLRHHPPAPSADRSCLGSACAKMKSPAVRLASTPRQPS